MCVCVYVCVCVCVCVCVVCVFVCVCVVCVCLCVCAGAFMWGGMYVGVHRDPAQSPSCSSPMLQMTVYGSLPEINLS